VSSASTSIRRVSPRILLVFLAASAFTLATLLQPRTKAWTRQKDSDSVLKTLLGDTRRLFSNHLFVKADVSFHSGYYPSIFDQTAAPKDSRHMMADEHADHDEHEDPDAHDPHEGHDDHQSPAQAAEAAHEAAMDFLKPPKDWIEAFGRHFMITKHTHLGAGREREILPWLKIASELDPQRIDTYTVSAYWLRSQLGKIDEAEEFLREGLRNNPDSYEILYELGRVLDESRNDPLRARNLWLQALKKWTLTESKKEKPHYLAADEIITHLARLEEREGNLSLAISYWQMAMKLSPSPADIERHIQELKERLAKGTP
jgi:tetratricopeptide (TPR) repeat protein